MDFFKSFPVTCAMAFIANFESCRLRAYQCSAGVWTIGYGHTKGVKQGDVITQDQAEAFFVEDLSKTKDGLAPYIKPQITENQFVALLSLAFNCGVAAIGKSTLVRYLNHGLIDDAANQFLLWCNVNGKKSRGLQKRRREERALFLTGEEDDDF